MNSFSHDSKFVLLFSCAREIESINRIKRTSKYLFAALSCAIFLAGIAKAADSSDSSASNTLEKGGCLHCHSLDGKGGLIGPPFDNIAKFRNESFIVNRLTSKAPIPKDYPKNYPDPKELMNHVRVDKVTAQKLADYLISHTSTSELSVKGHGGISKDDVPAGFSFEPLPVTQSSRQGMALYRDKGCAACHSIGLIGGRFGPALDGVGAKRSRKFIENRISAGAIVSYGGKEYQPSAYNMPPSTLSQKQIKQLTDFLLTIPK